MMRITALFFGLLGPLLSLAQSLPIDRKATAETKNLYANLQRVAAKGTMFGHQDDLAYGVGWQYQPDRSDIKDVVGDYPAVFGWDLGRLEFDSSRANLDGVPFDRQRALAQQAYAQGGLNTYSWHLNNPLDPKKTSWDKQDSTIRRLFADRKALKRYRSWLKKVAVYMKSLKGANGEAIPVIFRPFHEHTGSWFWWGKNHCSPAEYVKMWRYTVDYLRKKKVHNLLYAYSTDRFTSRDDYLERYPGDDYVDIVGFDIYHRPRGDTANRYLPETRKMVETLRSIGQEKRKPWAMTETGLAQVSLPTWWTTILLPLIQDSGLSYVLVWRNEGQKQYFAPFQGQASADNFRTFYQDPRLLFGKKTAAERLYAPTQPTQ